MIWPARICAIEISHAEVKAAVVRQRGNTARVLTLASRPIDQTADEEPRERAIRALEQLMEDHDLSAEVYVGCLPATAAIVRPIEIPFTGRRRVAAALKYEIEPVVPFPIDELLVDHVPVRQHDKKTTDVLAVGLRTETVRFHLEVLEGVGLDPDRMDLDVAGLTNLWRTVGRHGDRSPEGISLTMHVRDECTYFVALDGRAPVFMRAMNFGAAELAEEAPVAVEEVLATVRSVSAEVGQSSFSRLVVTGLELDGRVLNGLAERVGMPVRCVVPDSRSMFHGWPEEGAGAGPNYWEPLIGLAADGGHRDWIRFNFRQENLARTLITPELRRRALFSGGLAGVLVLVGILSFFRSLDELRAEADRLDDAIVQVYETTFPDAAPLPPSKIPAKMQDEEMKQTTDRLIEPFLGGHPSAIEVLDALSGCVPQDESVEVTRLELTAGIVRLSGMTTDPEVPGRIRAQLEGLECLDEVELEKQEDVIVRRGKKHEKTIEFSIRGRLKKSKL